MKNNGFAKYISATMLNLLVAAVVMGAALAVSADGRGLYARFVFIPVLAFVLFAINTYKAVGGIPGAVTATGIIIICHILFSGLSGFAFFGLYLLMAVLGCAVGFIGNALRKTEDYGDDGNVTLPMDYDNEENS